MHNYQVFKFKGKDCKSGCKCEKKWIDYSILSL